METDSDQEESNTATVPPSMAQPATPTDWSIDPTQIKQYFQMLVETMKLSPEIALQTMQEHPNAMVSNSVLSMELHKIQVMIRLTCQAEAEATPVPEDQWTVP